MSSQLHSQCDMTLIGEIGNGGSHFCHGNQQAQQIQASLFFFFSEIQLCFSHKGAASLAVLCVCVCTYTFILWESGTVGEQAHNYNR